MYLPATYDATMVLLEIFFDAESTDVPKYIMDDIIHHYKCSITIDTDSGKMSKVIFVQVQPRF